ncbi:MAG: beta-lactamase class C [Flavobacteriales bacterium]|jgi:beta-lactamase class C
MSKVVVSVLVFCVCSVLFTSPVSAGPVSVNPVSAGPVSLGVTSFNKALDHFIEVELAPKTQGYAIGVIVDGQVESMRVGGLREVGRDGAINIDTVFRLASVSKTFTPAIVAAHPELDYSESVSANLPNLQLSSKDYLHDLSLGHLLSQSSGLFPHAYTNLIQDNVPYERIVKQLNKVNFVCAPGKCYGYQNVIYSLAGDVLAAKLGEPYEALVSKSLLQPLGMTRSSLGRKNFLAEANRASPHKWNKRAQQWDVLAVEENYYRIAPAAGVNSSLRDMMVWLRAQLGRFPKVMGSEALVQMHSRQVPTSRKLAHYKRAVWDGVSNMGYAYGWRTFDFTPILERSPGLGSEGVLGNTPSLDNAPSLDGASVLSLTSNLDTTTTNTGSSNTGGEEGGVVVKKLAAGRESTQASAYPMAGFVHHGGWVKGVRTEMVFNPELNMGMVYLSNAETSFASEIVPRVLRLYARHIVASK